MAKQYLNLDVNRAEGDLEVKVEYENGQVSDAWFSGTMFRGFEEILKGRDYRDIPCHHATHLRDLRDRPPLCRRHRHRIGPPVARGAQWKLESETSA